VPTHALHVTGADAVRRFLRPVHFGDRVITFAEFRRRVLVALARLEAL
jgi:hypothetical protein